MKTNILKFVIACTLAALFQTAAPVLAQAPDKALAAAAKEPGAKVTPNCTSSLC